MARVIIFGCSKFSLFIDLLQCSNGLLTFVMNEFLCETRLNIDIMEKHFAQEIRYKINGPLDPLQNNNKKTWNVRNVRTVNALFL